MDTVTHVRKQKTQKLNKWTVTLFPQYLKMNYGQLQYSRIDK